MKTCPDPCGRLDASLRCLSLVPDSARREADVNARDLNVAGGYARRALWPSQCRSGSPRSFNRSRSEGIAGRTSPRRGRRPQEAARGGLGSPTRRGPGVNTRQLGRTKPNTASRSAMKPSPSSSRPARSTMEAVSCSPPPGMPGRPLSAMTLTQGAARQRLRRAGNRLRLPQFL